MVSGGGGSSESIAIPLLSSQLAERNKTLSHNIPFGDALVSKLVDTLEQQRSFHRSKRPTLKKNG